MDDPRTIVAMGGGGFSMDPDTLLDDHILDLAREQPRTRRGRGSASSARPAGDADGYLARFYAAFARRAEASHLALFVRTEPDIDAFLLDQDVIYVGGGNTANMLADLARPRRRPRAPAGMGGRGRHDRALGGLDLLVRRRDDRLVRAAWPR